MSAEFDSIYPDFLRTGLNKLHRLGVGHDLLALFSALEHFRRDLQERESFADLLQVTHHYVSGLNLFHTQAFYLVEAGSFGFELALCEPAARRPELEAVVKGEIRRGRFAWALRQNAPVFFESKSATPPVRGLFHSMSVAARTMGMFCGLLRSEPVPAQDITFNLLSMLLGTSADALAAARKTADLTHQIKTLRGLLPICAWCKKVRDDQGYWKQIESYVESHSDATFSHGMCPECAQQMIRKAGLVKK